MTAFIVQAGAIAVGIAGGVWLAGVLRALRWAIGRRLYSYAQSVLARERARRKATAVVLDLDAIRDRPPEAC